MKTSVRLLAVAVAMLVVTSTAMAQGPRGGGGRGFGGGMGGMGTDSAAMLRNEKVQKALELSADQVEQLGKVAQEARDARGDLRDLDREEMMSRMREMREKTQSKINDILLPHQRDRLSEIQIQINGARALMQEDVAKKLNLTDDQKEKLREAFSFRRGGRAGNRGEGERPDFQQMMEEQTKEAMGVLTDSQKEQFEKMKGKDAGITRQDLFQGFGRGGEGRGRGEGRGGRGGEGRGGRGGEGRGGRGEGRAPRDA